MDLEICVILIFGMGNVSPPRFVYDLSRKMFVMLYSINLPKLIIPFTSRDIGQYVYRSC